jgi:hypothetical protein
MAQVRAPVVDIVTEMTGPSPRVDELQILKGVYDNPLNQQESKTPVSY